MARKRCPAVQIPVICGIVYIITLFPVLTVYKIRRLLLNGIVRTNYQYMDSSAGLSGFLCQVYINESQGSSTHPAFVHSSTVLDLVRRELRFCLLHFAQTATTLMHDTCMACSK